MAREVIDREGRSFLVEPPPDIGASVQHARGRLLTVDRVVLRAADKGELHRAYQADLVDMESSAVAAVCQEKLVRFLSIRVISDDAHGDLPDEIAAIMNPVGCLSRGSDPPQPLAAAVERQGFLEAIRALDRGRRSPLEIHHSLPRRPA